MTDHNDPSGSQPYATFVVELLLDQHRDVRRTRVAHVQTGAHETWVGWDERSLLSFVVTRLGGRERASQPGSTSGEHRRPRTAAPGAGDALGIEVKWLSIDRARSGGLVERPAGSSLRGQVRFTVVGGRAGQVSNSRTPYAVQVLACELTSGRTVLLATFRQRLCPQVLDYVVVVEFILPDMGRSRLQVLVLLSEAEAVSVTLGPVVVMTQMPGGSDG